MFGRFIFSTALFSPCNLLLLMKERDGRGKGERESLGFEGGFLKSWWSCVIDIVK